MSNPHITTHTHIQSADIKTSAWVHNERPEVVSLLEFAVRKNSEAFASFSIWPTADETRALIANLEQHLHNLKTCELELLAQQPQAKAA